MTRKYSVIATLTTCLLTGMGQAGAVTIGTTASWDGSSSVYPWGYNDVTETYGQSVTAPAHATSLEGFSFNIQDVNDYIGLGVPGPITYQAYVYQWDPVTQHITGSPLWQSGVLQTPGTNTAVFQTTSFSTPGASVTPNKQYMLFLTTDGIATPTNGNTDWGFLFSDAYSGGAFYFLNDPNFGDLSTTPWSNSSAFGSDPGSDLAFTASFQIPEPRSVGLLGFAMLGLGVLRRRRRMT